MDTITVNRDTWQWAQDAALLLAALRICGIENTPIWIEAQRMCSESPPPSQVNSFAIARNGRR
jgi:hypothetical protein